MGTVNNNIIFDANLSNAKSRKQGLEMYASAPESSIFDGRFITKYGQIIQLNHNGFGSDGTRRQTITYNNDGTADITTYFTNDEGTDEKADEIIRVAITSKKILADGKISYDNSIKLEGIYFDIDSKIDYFKQGYEIGDCAYLSSLLSLSETEVGSQALADAITMKPDGSYDVCFQGIDTTVNVTQEELTQARKSDKYSSGDNTVLLMELSAEKAIQHLHEMFENEVDWQDDIDMYAKYKCLSRNNWLEEEKSPIHGFDFFNIDMLFGLQVEDNSNLPFKHFDKSDLSRHLDVVNGDNVISDMNFESEATLTSDNGQSFEILPNHAYAVKCYNTEDGTLTIINPHDSSDSLTVPIEVLQQYGAQLKYTVLKT